MYAVKACGALHDTAQGAPTMGAAEGRLSVVRQLLLSGSDAGEVNREGVAALQLCVREAPGVPLLRLLLRAAVHASAEGYDAPEGQDRVTDSATSASEAAERLFAAVSHAGANGRSALLAAAAAAAAVATDDAAAEGSPHVVAVKYLLACVRAGTVLPESQWQQAAHDRTDLLRRLLLQADNSGVTVFHECAQNSNQPCPCNSGRVSASVVPSGAEQMMRLLLASAAAAPSGPEQLIDVSGLRDSTGKTALHAACLAGNDGIVRLLLQPSPAAITPWSLSQADHRGHQPLYYAACQGHWHTLALLLLPDPTADPAAAATAPADPWGGRLLPADTVIAASHSSHLPAIVTGRTPLHIACQWGRLGCVALLIEATLRQTLPPAHAHTWPPSPWSANLSCEADCVESCFRLLQFLETGAEGPLYDVPALALTLCARDPTSGSGAEDRVSLSGQAPESALEMMSSRRTQPDAATAYGYALAHNRIHVITLLDRVFDCLVRLNKLRQ
jgi:ankyrin repeat protein